MIVIYIHFQASGRGGRSGDSAHSIVYCAPKDCPLRNEPKTVHKRELNEVRLYLQNSVECRRKRLLEYFDPKSAKPGDDPKVCCDVCATSVQAISTSSELRPWNCNTNSDSKCSRQSLRGRPITNGGDT